MPILDGSSYASFVVRLSQAATEPVKVDWRTESVTAVPGTDYQETAGAVEFLPTETQKVVQVLVYGRAPGDNQPREFRIHLLPAPNVVLGQSTTNCIIDVRDQDDVVISTVTVASGQSGLNAYEVAKLQGFQGTPTEWINSLKVKGDTGDTAWAGMAETINPETGNPFIPDATVPAMVDFLEERGRAAGADAGAEAGADAASPFAAAAQAAAQATSNDVQSSGANADRAEMASLAAATLGNAFDTIDLGLAGTAEGSMFSVYGPAGSYVTTYKKVAGLPVKKGNTPSATKLFESDFRQAIPKSLARRAGVTPLVEDRFGNIWLWLDDAGRIGAPAFASGPNPEPIAIVDGKAVSRRAKDGTPVEWYDYRRGQLRHAGDAWDRPERGPGNSAWAVMAKNDVLTGISPDGAVMEPASAIAPVAFVRPVDDGGGPINQVFVATGSAIVRLTAGMVNCYAPKVIAPGLVKYCREDGTLSIARFFVSTVVAATSIIAIVLHGQSLAMGTTDVTIPVRTPYNPDPNIIMFNGGIRSAARNNVVDASLFTSQQPAYEQFGPPSNSTRGETGLVTMAFTLRKAISPKVLLSVSGQGGTAFQDLGPGTQYWTNMLFGVQRGKDFATASGDTFSVPAFYFRQGEDNAADTATQYQARLTGQLAPAVHADIPAITGQTTPPIIVLQQISHAPAVDATGFYAISGPGEAQGRVWADDARFITACPQYLSELIDTYHMPASGSALMGSYAAKAVRRHLYQGMPWRPLHMSTVTRMGRRITVKFAGGWLDYGGKLTVDISRVTDPGKLGFAFADSTMSAAVISAEQVSDTEFVVWLSAEPTGANMRLGLAFWAPWATGSFRAGPKTGLRSPIRDNDPECCLTTGIPLHNYPISQVKGLS